MLRHPRRTTDRAQDEGFSLVEIILAMFIVVSVMTAVLGVAISTLGTLAQAKQRQSATALATEAIESMRALPYATVTAGSPLACDATLGLTSTTTHVTAAAAPTFSPPAALLPIAAEPLVVNTQSPCKKTVIQGSTTYTVHQYVTRTAGADAFSITAIVTWKKHGGAIVSTIERTSSFSPGGCLQETLHPFSGPCQAAFSARAGSDAFGIAVAQVDPATGVAGPTIASLVLPAASTNVEVEQTVAITGTGIGAGAQDAAGTGVQTMTVLGANSDPTSGSARSYNQAYTVPGGALAPVPLSATSSSSSGDLKGAIAASSVVCSMPTATGTVAVATGPAAALRPCGVSTISLSGNSTIDLSGILLARGAGLSASAGAAHIFGGVTAGICGTTAPGCARASVNRSIDSLEFLPGVGTAGMLQLANLDEFARAEEGDGAVAPTATRSGTLTLWDGTADVVVPIGTTTSGTWSWGDPTTSTYPAITTPAATIQGSITVTPAGTTTATPTGCAESACITTQQSGAITGTFLVTTIDGTFRVTMNVGGVGAVAAYQAAPSG